MSSSENTAFIVGVALGDGNLSNPNKRAVRLRVTCDAKYPAVTRCIVDALERQFPKNKVSLISRKDNCVDVSVYSNNLLHILPWTPDDGSKYEQNVRVPNWILERQSYIKACLHGLFLTDGSVYDDRGYKMANYTTNIAYLAADVQTMIETLGFRPSVSKAAQPSGKPKITIRIARQTEHFLKTIRLTPKT